MDFPAADAFPGDVQAHERLRQALTRARSAQPAWAAQPVRARLRILRQFRHACAADPRALLDTLAAKRPAADTLAAELLPLLAGVRFLERQAGRLLAPRKPRGGRPPWLAGVSAEVRRVPYGVVLILAPSNYPLLLAGAQALQALAAGNAVCVKPAEGWRGPMEALGRALARAGLPDGVFSVLDDTAEAGAAAASAAFDRIVLTGSATTGAKVLQTAAPSLTPVTAELSGCDALFVLDGADLGRVAACIAYGLRLNGGATCIAPRRVFVTEANAGELERLLLDRLPAIAPAKVAAPTRALLERALAEAAASGAVIHAAPSGDGVRPIVVSGPGPDLLLMREDIFAPVVSIVPVSGTDAALAIEARCPYALGASVFGPEREAIALASRLRAGSVTVNDLIVPAADPRLPFGGAGRSGFGVTRGAEGLLEMTRIQVISVRRGRLLPHLAPPRARDAALFAGMIALCYAPVAAWPGALWRALRGRAPPV